MDSSLNFLNCPSLQVIFWVNQLKALGVKYSLAWVCKFIVHSSPVFWHHWDTSFINITLQTFSYFRLYENFHMHVNTQNTSTGNCLHSGYSPDCSIKWVLIKFISTAPWHLGDIKSQYSCEISMCYYLFITEGEARKLSSLSDVPGEEL